MATSFYWGDKARRRSCHRRNDSNELDVFEAEHYLANENLGHRNTTLSQKLGLATRDQLGHHGSTTTRQNWRDFGRVSLDMTHHQNAFLDTMNPPKDKNKHKNPTSPGGKLASFFNSLITQTVSKKKKQSKATPQSVKDLVDDENPSGWRRKRRSSISHFRSSASSSVASFSSVFVSRKPNGVAPRAKRTSMSDIESKSIESCPPYMINTPIKPYKNNNMISKVQSGGARLDWLSEKRSSRGFERHVGISEKRKEFKSFVEEDGAESDSSSDLFELKLNYDDHELGYCGSGLPVYETTHMDSIKISSKY